ncbi:MAG: hypothetical protein U0570_09570 [Phycisphaerales bacterium]
MSEPVHQPEPAGRDAPVEVAQPASAPPAAPESRRRRPLEWLKSELAIAKGRESDRWSHRRGEPRNFAFLWAIYLMLGSLLALGVVLAGGIITLDAYQPLSRGLVITLAVGVLVFWPLIRLSQVTPDEGPLLAVIKDLAIVLIPLQAVVWPQMVLARWTPDIVLAAAAAMSVWAVLLGAIVAMGIRSDTTWRTAWMGLVLALSFGGPVIAILAGRVNADLLRPPQPGAAHVLVLASGIGLVADISADRAWSGSWALATVEHWRAIWGALACALVLWVVAARVCRRPRPVLDPETGLGEPIRLDSDQEQRPDFP